ncbi:YncE family protein [Clostridium grantii]|uniref:40-residue YVTN family beta-propeller repeat-containing protein n=1 Tax=Clostridium grantii DSM 8605 TaxID=1121316 RepID=A0A1M5VU90_9CLOT|nr:YncE family protein [Clostridium grantii]SHH78832.1 40-residue YVTN family beta-propeller repeat-containing protein [Clostridium grantii DSM 8605]
MESLCVCNTNSDSISCIELEQVSVKKTIILNSKDKEKIGPHGIVQYKNSILVANNYSNNLKVVELLKKNSVKEYFVGMHCNDLVEYEDKAYITCGESNSVVVIDLISMKVIEEIPCENEPHSIEINKEKKTLVVTNFNSDSITIIDLMDMNRVLNIRVGEYPTKAIFSPEKNEILVCESYIGSDKNGCVSMLSLESFKVEKKIEVNRIPVDLCCNNENFYVSNFGDGYIHEVNLKERIIKRTFSIGGMPRGMVLYKNFIFIGDNYNNKVVEMDLITEDKKAIPVGSEPTGMAMITLESK